VCLGKPAPFFYVLHLMALLWSLARFSLCCIVRGSAPSAVSYDDHVSLLQTRARHVRMLEEKAEPAKHHEGDQDSVVGVGKYNHDYYTTVTSVTRRGSGEVALEFDAVGDGTWDLQDPETSAISWKGGEAIAEKDVYTAESKKSHIAGVLVFKGVPDDKKLKFRFGGGGFSLVRLGVVEEQAESHYVDANKNKAKRTHAEEKDSEKSDEDEVEDDDDDEDEHEDNQDDSEWEAKDQEEKEEVESDDRDEDDEAEEDDDDDDDHDEEEDDDHSEEDQHSFDQVLHAEGKRHGKATSAAGKKTMAELSGSVSDALRRLGKVEHQFAEVKRAMDKDSVAKEQAEIAALASKNLRPVRPVLFVKTHRTGASTIVSMLHRIGDNRDMSFMLPPVIKGQQGSPSFGWPGSFPGSDALATLGAPEHQYDMMCSNGVFNSAKMLAYMRRQPFVFTVLRNPGNQAVSAFGAFKPPSGTTWAERIEWLKLLRRSPSPRGTSELQVGASPAKHGKHRRHRRKSHAHEDEKDVAALQREKLRAQFLNPQAHDLGWYERLSGSRASDRDQAAIAEWLGSLDEELGFVLLTEHFKEGLVLLSKRLGVGLEAMAHFNMKVMAQKDKLQPPTPEEVTQIEELYSVDMALYSHFNHTFWREWHSQGGYPALQGEIDLLNSMNGKIAGACAKGDATLCPWRVKADDDQYVAALRQKQAAKTKV